MSAKPRVAEEVADDIGAVTEALIELHRHTLAGRPGASPKFAKLSALYANRRGENAPDVINLAPSSDAVIYLAAGILSDLEVWLRTALR